MNIKIKTVKGKETNLEVNESDTIDKIIQQTKGEEGFERIINLVYRGRRLDNTMTVKEAGISNNSILICYGCESHA